MKAAEQMGNLRVRLASEAVDEAERQLARARGDRGRTAARRKLNAVIARERPAIASAIADLKQLAAAHPSMERENLCGSAYKRLALLENAAGRPDAGAVALAEIRAHYKRAEALGRENQLDFFYPAMNRMAAELALHAGTRGWKGLGKARVDEIRKVLQAKAHDDPEFWSVGGLIELKVWEALERQDLGGLIDDITAEFKDLHENVRAELKWQSIYDTARFVLPRYASRAPATEQKAAQALLKTLAGWADAGES
jgi:hypothetical protein